MRASAPDYAGLRSWRRAKSTGRFVGVYDGIEAQMDTEAGRWQTVCEDHAQIISHQTLALAMRHAVCPEDWCDICREYQDAIREGRPVRAQLNT